MAQKQKMSCMEPLVAQYITILKSKLRNESAECTGNLPLVSRHFRNQRPLIVKVSENEKGRHTWRSKRL